MSGWTRVCIDDVCEAITDCVNKTAPTVDGPTPYKMIRTTNVRNGWVDLTEVRYVTEETFQKWNRRGAPKPGDVILTREAPLGEVGLLRHPEQVFLGQRLVLYRADRSQLDPRFLLYAFQGYDIQAQIRGLGSGSTVEHMRVPDAKALMVLLPPLPEQEGIAEILSAYDDLIENNTRRISILEEMAQAIYREWFVHFRFPGHERVEMVDTEVGVVPAGWEIVPLSAIARQLRTNVQPADHPGEVFAHYSIPAFDAGRLPSLEAGSAISSTKHEVGQETVLISKLNPRIPRVWFPEPPSDRRAICSTEFVVLRPRGVSREFLFATLGAPEFLNRLTARAGGTSTSHQRVKPNDLLAMRVPRPDRTIIQAFADTVRPMLVMAEKLRQRNVVLRETRDLLLPRLLSGEVDVSAVEDALAGTAL